MSVSDIDIVNQGLVHIGERTIASLVGGLKRQEVAAALYSSTRQALLSEINWRFATHTQLLAQESTAPNNTRWKFAYALPTDPKYLKVQSLQPGGEHAIEGNLLLSDANSVLLTYTADAAEGVMPPFFSALLGFRMGWVMAWPLTKSRRTEQSAKEKYDTYLPTAKFASASQQPNVPHQDQPFIDARF